MSEFVGFANLLRLAFAQDFRNNTDRKYMSNRITQVKQQILDQQSQMRITPEIIIARQLLDGAFLYDFDTNTVQGDAGDYGQIKKISSISDVFDGLDSVEDNKELVVDKATRQIYASSTKPFILFPILVRLENGDSIPTASITNHIDPIAVVDSATAGHFACKLGEALISKKIIENGNPVWVAKGGFDYTKESKKFLKAKYRLGIEEGLAPVLEFCAYGSSAIANTSITVDTINTIMYHFQETRALKL